MSKASRLVRTWATESEPVQLFSDCAAPPTLRALPHRGAPGFSDEILSDARREAEEMRARAAAEIEQRWEQVRAEALVQARAEIQAEFEALVDASFQRWNQVVGASRSDQQRISAAVERDLIELAVAIAGEAIGEAVSEEAVQRRVRNGLDALSSSEIVTVLLNPDDVPLVAPWIERWQEAESVQVEVVPDRAIEPGGCQVVTRSGIYDFGPRARLEMIGDALRAGTDAGTHA